MIKRGSVGALVVVCIGVMVWLSYASPVVAELSGEVVEAVSAEAAVVRYASVHEMDEELHVLGMIAVDEVHQVAVCLRSSFFDSADEEAFLLAVRQDGAHYIVSTLTAAILLQDDGCGFTVRPYAGKNLQIDLWREDGVMQYVCQIEDAMNM